MFDRPLSLKGLRRHAEMIAKLHQLLENAATARPDAIALTIDGQSPLTYRALDRRSDAHRDILRANDIRPGDRVGIWARKTIETVVAIFGILKCDAAYVPVDAGAPPARNLYIFKDCDVRAILVEERYRRELEAAHNGGWTRTVDLGGGFCYLTTPAPGDRADGWPYVAASPTQTQLAYILYTSGSTGTPKGVMHTHASALSFVDWCSETFQPRSSDRFSSHAPFHFDLSILDLYVSIKHGATLVLIDEELGKKPVQLAHCIAAAKISVWYSTPSILQLLTQFGKLDRWDYSDLRVVIFAGEVFPLKHVRTLKERWPSPRYFNLYGPTETNVCTYFELPPTIPADQVAPFPIGKVCANDRGLVMDEKENPLSPGGEGELYIGGGSVMLGYWNLPDRTKAGFYTDRNGTNWYKTGDIVRQDARGDYIYVGRRDRMVKRRGFRVELGEIEAGLYRHPAIAEAAVIALPDDESGVRIEAFLCCAAENRPSLVQLKRFCAGNVPSYMIPDSFTFVPSLPKTSTDKIDYRKLTEVAARASGKE